MLRLAVVFSFLTLGFVWGGWMGLYGMLLLFGLLGACFPSRARVREETYAADDKAWEKVEPARRGRSADPTRPDDHPLMLTNEISRRR